MEFGWCCRALWSRILSSIARTNETLRDFFCKAWEIAIDDPRKIVHGFKVGLALTVVSFFYYLDVFYDDLKSNAIWTVITVVVASEFTIGASLYKGLNRIFATSLGGFLLLGLRWIGSKSGHTGQTVILGVALFFIGSAATFSRFIPIIKTNSDYGVLIFILTYSMVSVSAYRVDSLEKFAEQRISAVVYGCLCWMVIMFIRPAWAGDDLHHLVVANFHKLADSIEGCTDEFFEENGNAIDGGKSKKSQRYVAVFNSKASEDSLANFAKWEPLHHNFGFRHPWHMYLNVTASLRHCSYSVEALHSCIHPDVEVADMTKKHLENTCKELSIQCSDVLRELSNSIKALKKSSTIDLLMEDMNSAVLDVQHAIETMACLVAPAPPPPLKDEETNHKGSRKLPISTLLLGSLPVANVALMLIEIASRVTGVVEAVGDLAQAASFKDPNIDDKPKQVDASNGGEDIITIQIV